MPSAKADGKRPALLTVDLEDYRRQELHRLLGGVPLPNPHEVQRQLELVLQVLASLNLEATFFTVGRLTSELPHSAFQGLRQLHQVGCHGHEHLHVSRQGPRAFFEDLRRAKSALEDTLGRAVISYRAPYFSSDGCDPWFGDALARAGFRLDSSRRLTQLPGRSSGTVPVPGAAGVVIEVPLPSIGFGPKRLTIIGGTYFRLLPLHLIRALLGRSERAGFVPIIYLHPYDFDASARPLELPRGRHWVARAGDVVRRTGRDTAVDKLRALAESYDFRPLESMLAAGASAKGN
jgi:peptidoglycan/xylan/chitin deacetylase (PgdA/CDA1 family)